MTEHIGRGVASLGIAAVVGVFVYVQSDPWVLLVGGILGVAATYAVWERA